MISINNPVLQFGIEPEQLAEIIAFMKVMALKHHQNLRHISLVLVLEDYGKKFSLLDIWAYIKWGSSQTPDEHSDAWNADHIYSTIVHDLNYRNDLFFSPRTEGYYDVLKEYSRDRNS